MGSGIILDLLKYGVGLSLFEGIYTMDEAHDRVYSLVCKLKTSCLLLECHLGDIAIVGELRELYILSLVESDIEQLPAEIGQLTQLRLLDLSDCSKLKVIAPNVISRLSQLEELYMGNTSVRWEVEGVNVERKNASLDELKHLSKLSSLQVHIEDEKLLPKGLFSKKLERYKILIGDNRNYWNEGYASARTLKLFNLTNNGCFEDGATSQLHETQDENISENIALMPFFKEKVFMPNLEELEITIKDVTMIPEYICHKLKVLRVFKDESAAVFPVERFHNLKELRLRDAKYKEIFTESAAETSSLEPCSVPDLYLEILEVMTCHSLVNLLPSSASFENLTTLNVWSCDQLINLVTSSTAKSLVQLRISHCKMMTEIVADDQGDVSRDDEIIFYKLKTLKLEGLQSLTSFCSGNYTFRFPSLNSVFVTQCSNMKIFSQGVLSTPRLQHLFTGYYHEKNKCWEGDLNTTIQKLHKREMNVKNSTEDADQPSTWMQ